MEQLLNDESMEKMLHPVCVCVCVGWGWGGGGGGGLFQSPLLGKPSIKMSFGLMNQRIKGGDIYIFLSSHSMFSFT